MNAFIKQKASSRKGILSKFLELDVFERLSDAAREESAGVKQLIRSAPDRDFDVSIVDAKNKLAAKQKDRDSAFSELETLREKSKSLEITLAASPDSDIVTKQDVDEQDHRVSQTSEFIRTQKEIPYIINRYNKFKQKM